VTNIKELMERIQYIQDEFDSPALIEEYIEGREIYAGILGSYRKRTGIAVGGTGFVSPPGRHAQNRYLRREVRRKYRGLQTDENRRSRRMLDEETAKRLSDTALRRRIAL